MTFCSILKAHPRLSWGAAVTVGLTAALLAVCFTRGGTSAYWVQALAAWVQALLTAAAVGAAAWLQDRTLVRRETAVRKQRLEGAASIAKWSLSAYEETVRRARPQMRPDEFLTVFKPEEFDAAVRALRTIPLAELGDADLTVTVLRLETAMQRAGIELAATMEQVRRREGHVPDNINAADLVSRPGTDIFNPAAGVERRVAELVGRLPTR